MSIPSSVQHTISPNPLLRHTPKEMNGMEVIGSDGEQIGKIENIVSSKNRNEIHAVVSSGGFLGIGSRDILIPLSEMKAVGEGKLKAGFSRDAAKSRPQYHKAQHTELPEDRKLNEHAGLGQ